MTDLLDRVFGPEPESHGFPPLNQAKIIEAHDCEWTHATSYGMSYMACRVCGVQPPERLQRGEP